MKKTNRKSSTVDDAKKSIKAASEYFTSISQGLQERQSEFIKERDLIRKEIKNGARRTDGFIV